MSESENHTANEGGADKPLNVDINADRSGSEASPSRRRFTRQAMVGSAVVFSLANRSAWSSTGEGDLCVSKPFWDSYVSPDYVVSIAPGNDEKQQTLKTAQRIDELTSTPDYDLVDDGQHVCAVEVTQAETQSGPGGQRGQRGQSGQSPGNDRARERRGW